MHNIDGKFGLAKAVRYLFMIKQVTLSWVYVDTLQSEEYQTFVEFFGVTIGETTYFSKDKIDNFKLSHTQLNQVVNFIQENVTTNALAPIIQKCNMIGIKPIRFGNSKNRIFIHNNDVEKIVEYYKYVNNLPSKIYHKRAMIKHLRLSKSKIADVFKEYGITPYFTITVVGDHYHENDLNFLREEQSKIVKKLRDEYYILTRDIDALILKYKEYVNESVYFEMPAIGQTAGEDFKYTFTRKVILKKFIDELEEKRKDDKRKSITKGNTKNNINSNTTEVHVKSLKEERHIINSNINFPFRAYSELLILHNICFNDKIRFTSFHWRNFVRLKLNSSSGQETTQKKKIMLFVRITKLLSEVIKEQEIFLFSTKRIEFALFHKDIPIGWQLEYYSFLYALTKTCEKEGIKTLAFNIKEITNPKHKIGNKEKAVYNASEYLKLIEYVKSDIHKSKSIAEAMKQINGERSFTNYSNMWLYVTILLNNAWRHEDVLTLPTLPVSLYTNIDLDWLNDNDVTYDVANAIADHYRSLPYLHSKTGGRRFFIISDDLLVPFATSVIISSTIQRKLFPLSNTVINLSGLQSVYTYNHESFFAGYISEFEFKFRSLTMNRTLLSLMISVIEKLTNRNPVEVVKFLRNHSDVEVTNIYITIPQDKVNFISEQLFNIGNFGFVYDAIADILSQRKYENREDKTHHTVIIKQGLGSISAVEEISRFANFILEERDAVYDILNRMPTEDLRTKYTFLNLGILPSKSEDFQCLVGEDRCPFGKRNCESCPLSLPNLYTLSSINRRIQNKIQEFLQQFGSTQYKAEKIRLANQLFIERELLVSAIQKFGRERVDNFIDGGLNKINEMFSILPSIKEYITIPLES
ncbi:hypothetical protein [Paenibacillus rigui]|uniref:Uncharacterized protein n=1 Tax=Paenibacillus rigui TaxID=554312 RepID=A0A229UJW6_9BACL|nr:hypothetical protein [Paenibacillus rigui]OXM83686.1 hypothetical protein CF651_24110 [Paenibacillus rigui]